MDTDARAKALALADGLRKNTALDGRRWLALPGGDEQLARVTACIERVQWRLSIAGGISDADLAAGVADLRAILEWASYQTASVKAAGAAGAAHRTRRVATSLGLLGTHAPESANLTRAEAALIERAQTHCDNMVAVARRHPHLGLPPPLPCPPGLKTPAD